DLTVTGVQTCALPISTKGKLPVRTELVAGPIDETLVRFADTESSDLIVISARSRIQGTTGLGKTANQIISHTSVPVIVVRDPGRSEERRVGKEWRWGE